MKLPPTPNPSVLVGRDPTGGGTDALDWGARTATSSGMRLVLFSAFAELRESKGREEYLAARRAHEMQESAYAERLRDSGVPCVFESSNNDLRVAMLDAAREHDARLIVVGTGSTSAGPGFLHLGSTTEHLAHHTDRPFAVIRSPISIPEQLAVAVDGSAHGLAAVRWAASHARSTDAAVTPVTIERGVRSANELIAAATDIDADLIVVGASPVGDVLKRRVGGVALKVLHDARCSVVLVPETALDRPDRTTRRTW